MIIKIAEFKIKEEELKTALAAIKEFTQGIDQNEPNTFYEAYRRDDSFEFVHLMKFPDKQAEEIHSKAEYTQKFVEILYPRCEIKPKFTNLTPIEK